MNKEWLARMPMAVLAIALFLFMLHFPRANFDSDAAIFGLMGNDILSHHYWPSLPYGLNYLFSITPYVYALFRCLLPHILSNIVVWAIAGALLSLSGLWMIYESFLALQKGREGRLWLTGA